jgi:curved DNA-binding protein CbpA
MGNADHLRILDLPPDASQAEIKKAYRRLISKYHPDKNQDEMAVEKFHKIQNAYKMLTKGRENGLEPSVSEGVTDNPAQTARQIWKTIFNNMGEEKE